MLAPRLLRAAMDDDLSYLGYQGVSKDDPAFAIPQTDRRQHLYTIGRTGSGKTTLLRNLIIQDINAERVVCVGDCRQCACANTPTGTESWLVRVCGKPCKVHFTCRGGLRTLAVYLQSILQVILVSWRLSLRYNMNSTNHPQNTQGNITAVAAVLVGIAVLAGVVYWYSSAPATVETQTEVGAPLSEDSQSDAMMESDALRQGDAMQALPGEAADADEAMPERSAMEEEVSLEGDMIDRVLGSYETYAPEKLRVANSADVVVFFHASWCPICRAADSSFQATELPDGLVVLKADYDTETALRQKYGVTTQHTFVQVDSEGNLLKKWTGSRSAAEITAQTI